MLKLTFQIPHKVMFGQYISLIGSEMLGNWDVSKSYKMTWCDGDIWKVDVCIDAEEDLDIEYKYVVQNPSGQIVRWKPGVK